jgi:hypothetical protein
MAIWRAVAKIAGMALLQLLAGPVLVIGRLNRGLRLCGGRMLLAR